MVEAPSEGRGLTTVYGVKRRELPILYHQQTKKEEFSLQETLPSLGEKTNNPE